MTPENGYKPAFLDAEERIRRLERRIGDVQETADLAISRFPKNARVDNLGTEGHIHNPLKSGGGGLLHFDYIVDAQYTGPVGATVALTTGATSKIFATIQAAITQWAADAKHGSMFVNAGTYAENLVIGTAIDTYCLTIVGEWGGEYSGLESKVRIAPATGNALTFNHAGASTKRFTLINATVDPTSGLSLVGTAGLSIPITLIDVWLDANQTITIDNGFFTRVRFDTGIQIPATYTWNLCRFTDCSANAASAWAGTATDLLFTDFWTTNTITDTGTLDTVKFINPRCDAVFYHKNGGTLSDLSIVSPDFSGSDANGVVRLQSTTGCSGIEILGGHAAESGTNPIVTSADADFRNIVFAYTTLGSGSSAFGGVAASGIFGQGSVFGPFARPDTGITINTGSVAPILYIGTGAVGGTDPSVVTTIPGMTIEEDNATVLANTRTIDFTEPDATIVTGSGTEADVNLSAYALRVGRAGGQTLVGGTGANEILTLTGSSHATQNTAGVRLEGQVGILSVPVVDRLFNLPGTYTAKSTGAGQTVYLGAFETNVTFNSGNGLIFNALFGNATASFPTGSTGNTLKGLNFTVTASTSASGTITMGDMTACAAFGTLNIPSNATATITNFIGFDTGLVMSAGSAGTETITNVYGVRVADLNGFPTNLTNSYGVSVVKNTTGVNRFPFHDASTPTASEDSGSASTTTSTTLTPSPAPTGWITNDWRHATFTCNTRTLYITSSTTTAVTGKDGWSSDSGTANAAVSTTPGPPGTLTDTREAWGTTGTGCWTGSVAKCNGFYITVASNTATVLTGTAGWANATLTNQDPGDGNAWSLGDSGTADGAVTVTSTTLTDSRVSWPTNIWAGAVISCGGRTMTVASNTATVITGTASWNPTGTPPAGLAWTLSAGGTPGSGSWSVTRRVANTFGQNVQMFSPNATSFGGGIGVLSLANAIKHPPTNPSSSGFLFSSNGADGVPAGQLATRRPSGVVVGL